MKREYKLVNSKSMIKIAVCVFTVDLYTKLDLSLHLFNFTNALAPYYNDVWSLYVKVEKRGTRGSSKVSPCLANAI